MKKVTKWHPCIIDSFYKKQKTVRLLSIFRQFWLIFLFPNKNLWLYMTYFQKFWLSVTFCDFSGFPWLVDTLSMSELRPSKNSEAEYMYSRSLGPLILTYSTSHYEVLLLVSEEMYSQILVPPPLLHREIRAKTFSSRFITHNFWANDPYPFKIGEVVA